WRGGREGRRDGDRRRSPGCGGSTTNQPKSVSALVERHHTAAFDGERKSAVLERERLLAKKLAPPAVHRRHVGRIVGGDAVEVVRGGDHLGGDAVTLRRHAQEHLEQL